MRLSSTKNTFLMPSLLSSSSSRPTCSVDFTLGFLPNMTMMSQNSHLYGQPRENWRLTAWYLSSFKRSKRGVGESSSDTSPVSW